MTNTVEVKVPDIGDFDNIPVIEILVKVGETVAKDQGLVTLESDKATMEVPSSAAGVVKELKVKLGDGVSEGSVIAIVETAEAANAGGPSGPTVAASAPAPATAPAATPIAAPAAASTGRKADIECRMLVLGAGPGGYTAAFRSADLGLDTVLVERYPSLGGVCLNVGCIPSKALLHAAAVIDEAAHAKDYGIDFGAPKIGLDALRGYKEKVVGQLTKGLAGMSKQRKVRVVQGVGKFVSPHEIEIHSGEGGGDAGTQLIRFEQCIIAAGSQPVKLPAFPWDDPRVMDSTDALELKDIPKNLLVVGGGIIGLEMATVYRALGSAVTVVEFMDQIMPGTDTDLIKPLADRMKKQGVAIHLKTKVVEAKATKAGIVCSFDGANVPANDTYDRVLVAVGRAPNGKKIDADKAGVAVTERGFIEVDRQMRTNVAHIFAIGDLVGQPMLAHKATHEGKLAAEVAAGEKKEWVARVIPSVAYTDPEIAWVGVTETEAKAKGITVGVGKFPWAASGRAIGNGRTEGFTKLLFDEATHRVIGGGIVGTHAGDLIAEVGLAIEMGCEVADIGHTIHPHPTLSESVGMAAEVFDGTITDLYIPKKK
jgi:dihydrolipoamide dehydrogenase